MSFEKKISEGIMEAMKAKDTTRRDTLRNVKKMIIEAKTAGPNLEELPDADVLKIITKLSKQGNDTAEIYRQQGREDLYEYEMAQVNVLKEYLPEQLSPADLEAGIRKIIEQTGATSMKDMGKVMGIASKTFAGQAEGKDISDKVKELLS